MKQYRKIDLFWCGEYLCSTTQSRTLRLAKKNYLENLENRSHSFAGLPLVGRVILRMPNGLSARFDGVRK